MTNKHADHYDLFVIGAGSGGVRAARIAATHGAKVGIAEEKYLGGTCVNVGCVPKKLLVYASEFSRHFEDAQNFGWSLSGPPRFDWATLIKNKDKEIKRLNGIYKTLLEDKNVKIHDGRARFIDDHTLTINGKTVTADKILIATGGRPVMPDVPGKEHMKSSDEMFHLPALPRRIAVIGGGYIGLEFACIFNGLKTEVTLLHRGPHLLRGFDSEMASALGDEIRNQKQIDLHLNTNVKKLEKDAQGYVLHTSSGQQIACDMVLAATGRAPNTDDLGLENTSVALDQKGRVKIDKNYHSTAPHIYAVGDVCNDHNLTPVALAEGHVLMDRLIGRLTGRKVDYDFIATAVFSQPPLATVGLSEEQAEQAGFDIEIYKSAFKPMKNTISGREERSFMKLIVDKKSDRLLGFHMYGDDAAEIIQLAATVLKLKGTKKDLDSTIGVHPTAAEEFVTMRTPAPRN